MLVGHVFAPLKVKDHCSSCYGNAGCSSEQNQPSKVVPGVTRAKLCLKCHLCTDNYLNGMRQSWSTGSKGRNSELLLIPSAHHHPCTHLKLTPFPPILFLALTSPSLFYKDMSCPGPQKSGLGELMNPLSIHLEYCVWNIWWAGRAIWVGRARKTIPTPFCHAGASLPADLGVPCWNNVLWSKLISWKSF